jgi:hypothetical protein
MSNRHISNLDGKVLAVSLERAARKLGPIVSDVSLRGHKPADDGFDELDCGLLVDLDHRGHFRPLGEFVNGNIEIPIPFNGLGKRSQDVQPPHSEWP